MRFLVVFPDANRGLAAYTWDRKEVALMFHLTKSSSSFKNYLP